MKNKISHLLILIFSIFVHLTTLAQNKMVSGSITDSNGIPIPGANIVVKGSQINTISDFDGKYSINANTGSVLIFSSTGSKTIEKTVEQSSIIDITLTDEVAELKEVVVVGYG